MIKIIIIAVPSLTSMSIILYLLYNYLIYLSYFIAALLFFYSDSPFFYFSWHKYLACLLRFFLGST